MNAELPAVALQIDADEMVVMSNRSFSDLSPGEQKRFLLGCLVTLTAMMDAFPDTEPQGARLQ
jgi:hypothetical protein